MRNLLLIPLLFMLLSSCKKYRKDEDRSWISAKKRLVAPWKLVTQDGESLNEVSNTVNDFTDSCGTTYNYYIRSVVEYEIEFFEDKTYSGFSSQETFRLDFEQSFSLCDSIMKSEIITNIGDGKWQFRYLKNYIVLDGDEYRIDKLTDSELTLFHLKAGQSREFFKIK